MKKYAMILAILVLAAGCNPKYTPEAKELEIKQTAANLRIFQAQQEVCENNGGVKNITHGNATPVYCVNGVNTSAYN